MASPAARNAGSLQAIDGCPRSSAESIAKLDNAETHCLQALQRLNLEPAVPIFFDKSQAAVGPLCSGDKNVETLTNVYGLKTRNHFCYDYASTLFSLDELPVVDDVTMMLDRNEVNAAIQRPYKVQLDLKKPANNVFNIRDIMLPNEDHDLLKQPAHIIQFLELATLRYASHHPIINHIFFHYGFTSPDLDNGKYLAHVALKSVVCVEGPINKGAPALVINSKKTQFYKAGINILDLICEGLNISPTDFINDAQIVYINKYLKRLQVFTTYGERQTQHNTLKSLGQRDANNSPIELNQFLHVF